MLLDIRIFDIRGKYLKISTNLVGVNPNHKLRTPPQL
jgi:hypothetical protein